MREEEFNVIHGDKYFHTRLINCIKIQYTKSSDLINSTEDLVALAVPPQNTYTTNVYKATNALIFLKELTSKTQKYLEKEMGFCTDL